MDFKLISCIQQTLRNQLGQLDILDIGNVYLKTYLGGTRYIGLIEFTKYWDNSHRYLK